VFYKAHGANASWEWLEWIAPCVDVLRKLAKNFNNILGTDQGTRHASAPPNLSDDIQTLMESLAEHNVYCVQKGRTLDDDDSLVKDVISIGLEGLADGTNNPIWEFNDTFQRLQRRRRMSPVISGASPVQSADSKQHFEDLSAAVVPPNKADFHVSEEEEAGMDDRANELTASLFKNLEQEEMLSVLTAADVDLEMDEEVQVEGFVDDESEEDW